MKVTTGCAGALLLLYGATYALHAAHVTVRIDRARGLVACVDWDLARALDVPDAGPNPEQIATRRWQQAELFARVAALPLTLRQVATLALEGLSNVT